MKNTLTALTIILALNGQALAQTPFGAKDYVDINNIKAAVLLHGDMNWDPAAQQSDCEFPKGSGIHLSNATSVWMGGFDDQNQLHVSAQTYRQTGNDFWPGPLDVNGNLDMATSTKWARIWKVNFIEIGNHVNNTNRAVNNTPKDILEWPAKGNPHAKGNGGAALSITTDMAPFVDVNSDGSYNALDGDYPKIKGDQMLWWVFSDNGPTHDNTTSMPLHLETHACAYAYARGGGIDNIVFYEMDIQNKSAWNYSGFRLAISADMDLGYPDDDYIGFDSARRLGYVYNGLIADGTGQVPAYGNLVPVAGYTLLKMPGDAGTNYAPAGSFMTFNNDGSVRGNPQIPEEFYYYMTARFRDGQHLNDDFAGKGVNSSGRGPGPLSNYIFTGDPADTNTWSECNCSNYYGDRRFVLSTNDITINQNTGVSIAFALVTTDRGAGNTCPGLMLTGIKDITDTAWKYFNNPPASRLSVHDIDSRSALQLHPNPADDILYIDWPQGTQSGEASLDVFDVTGRKMNVVHTAKSDKIKVDVSSLPPGVYSVRVGNGAQYAAAVFVKQ